jgi:TonB family protein
VVEPRPSSRSALRTLGVVRRRESLPWQEAVVLLLVALLSNGVGVYSTAMALARALEPKPLPKREKVIEFNLLPGSSPDPTDVRPEDAGQGAPPEVQARAPEPSAKPKPGPARDKTETADERPGGEQVDEDLGVGDEDDSLVVADDGELEGRGAPAGGKPDPLAKLGGSTSMLDQTFGRPVASDRMRDVDDDATSMLDSKRHLFGSFFNRLRDRIVENAQFQKALDRNDPYGTRFGDAPRMTVLMIRLDDRGQIVKIVVEQKSGADYLDEEAERAVRAAGPFPNMPEGLVDEQGHLDFRFAFVVTIDGGSRIYRYQ